MGDTPHHTGHRKRLRDRFMKGPETVPDYEMLELVLFSAQPRGDVKPLAKQLITRFGSFAATISADPKELKSITGMGDAGAAALHVVREAALRLARDAVMNQSVISSWQQLLDYCRSSMAYNKTEQFRILFLNRKSILIADEQQQEGTVDHTPVYPREVVKRALELGASAIIMVHNHPSGDPKPSKADIEMTHEVMAAGEKLGIAVHDHIIIAKSGYRSFKSMGLL